MSQPNKHVWQVLSEVIVSACFDSFRGLSKLQDFLLRLKFVQEEICSEIHVQVLSGRLVKASWYLRKLALAERRAL